MIGRTTLVFFVPLLLVLLLPNDVDGWWWNRRRRRPPPPPPACTVNDWNWSDWGRCSCPKRASSGTRSRLPVLKVAGSCSGNLPKLQTEDCFIDCVLSKWGDWSSCSTTCGPGSKTRKRTIVTRATCGGSCINNDDVDSCEIACCKVDCSVGDWSTWTPASVACGTTADQSRERKIVVDASCGGTACPALKETQKIKGPCCPQDCQFTWGRWTACDNSCGKGKRTRKATVTADLACGGKACPADEEEDCVGAVNVDCQVGQWSAYGSCQPNDGVCGAGTKTRTRQVIVARQCKGNACHAFFESTPCSTCCPVDCVVGAWGAWGACSSKDCNLGKSTRSRTETTSPSCGGNLCPVLSESRDCTGLQKLNCVMDSWSSWTLCDNRCGDGHKKRTRGVTQSSQCGGSPCDPAEESTPCTSHVDNRDCTVGTWGDWGSCSTHCDVGTRERSRTVVDTQRCLGKACPALKETENCGAKNGGCAHQCNSGTCSCNSGFLLNSDGATCRRRDCGSPSATYCPSGTTHGTTCKYPTFSCNDGTTYEKSCSVDCPDGYVEPNGVATIACQASGIWKPYDTIWCSRINKPPTKIYLSSYSVMENKPAGTVIGVLTTTDPNPSDTHTYTLLNSASGRARIKGDRLLLNYRPDYESRIKSFTVNIRSTDNKGLTNDAPFTITILDENETPTRISLSNTYVNENSDTGTVIGDFTTTDSDLWQTHTVTILQDAGGRFRVKGNQLQVAKSNSKCLANGGSDCWLDYEKKRTYTIRVRSTDNGSPTKYVDWSFAVRLRDVNDQPRNLRLSGYVLRENALVGTLIGTLSASNEDSGETLTYELTNDAGGRFEIKTNQVVRAKAGSINYEETTSYTIEVRVTDNGKPSMSTSKTFAIEILNVNEPPFSMTFTSTGGQQLFANNAPKINENSAKGTTVGTLIAYDPDALQKLIMGLDDSAGSRFSLKTSALSCTSVNVNNLKTKCTVPVLVDGTIDYEANSQLTIVVRATDNGNLFNTFKFAVTIVDVNDRPSDVVLSSASVDENDNDANVGSFTTIDDDSGDSFTYALTDTAGSRFYLDGVTLKTTAKANLNYEVQAKYTIAVRSTDSGSLSRDKQFVVTVTDVNEKPGAVALSPNSVVENRAKGTVVGTLSANDPDNLKSSRQTLSYSLINSAGGRFEVVNGEVKVAISNVRCLALGGAECKINYEVARSHQITVRVTDNGSPPMHRDTSLTVVVGNANDQPRDLTLDNFKVTENKPAGTLVGTLSATDEDAGQSLIYELSDDDGGRFKLDGRRLLKAKPSDYETSKSHSVTVKVTDNGSPAESISKQFTIEVLNVKEPPVSIYFKDTGGQLTFKDDSPKVNENSALNTIVGIVEARDQEAGALKFSLDDSAGGLFKLATPATCTTSGGTVCSTKVLVAGTLNYESRGSQQIFVRATDNTGLFVVFKFTISVVDVNDKPKDITLSSKQIAENRKDALVGDFVTIDDDSSQSHTYALISNPGSQFVIVGNTLRVSKSATLDYETATQYTIVVRSTDNGSPTKSVDKSFVIQILNVNEPPTAIALSGDSVDENSNKGTPIGSFTTTDQDTGQSHVVSLLDDAGGRFLIKGAQLQVAKSNSKCLSNGGKDCWLNSEEKSSYTIKVRSSDNGSPKKYLDKTFTIRIVNVNDQPRDLQLSGFTLEENSLANTVIGTLSASDEDVGQRLTFQLTNNAGGRFVIIKNNQVARGKSGSIDYEAATSYDIKVQVKDDGNPSMIASKKFTIKILNVNEPPVSVTFTSTGGQQKFSNDAPAVAENTDKGTRVGTLVAYDADAKETLAFSLDDSDGGRFALQTSALLCEAVNVNNLKTKCTIPVIVGGRMLDYESNTQHAIIVRVTDNQNFVNTKQFTIKILDVNDQPSDVLLSGTTVMENLNDATVGSLTTVDDDPADTFKYTLTQTAGDRFYLDGTTLKTTAKANLNYELQTKYTIVVRSTDSGSLSFDKQFVITVEDVNEEPSDATISRNSVVENRAKGTVVGTLSASDPDNLKSSRQTLTYSIVDSDGGRFEVVNGVVKVAISNVRCLALGGAECKINYEVARSHQITVRATDNGSPPRHHDTRLTVVVGNANDQPRHLTLDNFKVTENEPAGTLVGTLSAMDEDVGQRLTYQLTDDDGGRFKLDGRRLLKAKPSDYETSKSHSVTVNVTDNGSQAKSMTKKFTIEVLNIKEPPVSIYFKDTGGQLTFKDDSPKVNENSALKTIVGIVEARDQDPGALKFSLDDSAGNLFELTTPATCTKSGITVCSAKVLVAAGNLDYESKGSHQIIVRATDNTGLFVAVNFTISVVDVNDKPEDIILSTMQIAENTRDALVGDFLTIDDDSSQSHTYALVNGGAGGRFVIVGNTLRVSKSATLDYETAPQYTIVVRSTDNGTPAKSIQKSFVIQILNVNEPPTAMALSGNSVDENSEKGTPVGSLTTSDPDKGQLHVFSLLDDAGGRFLIKGTQLQVAKSNAKCLSNGGKDCWLNYEEKTSYTIKVRCSDNGSPTKYLDKLFTVRILNVNDKPRDLQLSGFTLKENSPANTVIGTLSASNEDVGETLTFELTNDAAGRFVIINKNQVARGTSGSIDYEATTSYAIVARVKDDGKPSMNESETFTIEIVDVNEPPLNVAFTSTNGQRQFLKDAPTVDENTAKGTRVGTLVAYDADAKEMLAFSLDDSAGGLFSLETSALLCTPVNVNNLKTKCTIPVIVSGALDYESDTQHQIIVRVTDDQNLVNTTKFTIKILDVNDRPSDVLLSGTTVKENLNDATVGSFSTIDDDPADTFTYTLTQTAGGRFYLDGTTLKTTANANLNYELQTQYKIVVRSTDSGSLYLEKQFVITVEDVNEKPGVVTISQNIVVENSVKGTIVGTLSVTDPDNFKSTRQTLVYSMIDSAGDRFEIVNGVVRVALSNARCLARGGSECKINYEVAHSHQVVVRATDNGSPPMYRDTTLTVLVKNANDQPRDLSLSNFKVKENEPIDTLVGTLSATDEDVGQSLTYQLTDDDGGRFKLNGRDVLKAKSADYETSKSHKITVKVTDNGSPAESMTKVFTIEVLNVKEPPVSIHFKSVGGQLNFPDDSPKVNENTALKTAVGIVEARDQEPGPLTFSLDDSAGNLFELATPATCTTTSGGTVCSTKVLVAGSLDYEEEDKHQIIVRATDNATLFKVVNFTIVIVDVNDKPDDIDLTSPEIAENSNDALVGDLVTVDDDSSQTHAYALLDDAGGRFVLVNGQIRTSKAANLNYETATTHAIVVRSTDNGSPALSVTKSFVIRVIDVNELPTFIRLADNYVPENRGAGTRVGSLSTSDPDNLRTTHQSFNYTIIDDAEGRFKLKGDEVQVASSNVRCLADGGDECVLNFENATEHRIVVRVVDSGSPPLSLDYALAIRVTDANDRPRGVALSNWKVFENSPPGYVVGTLSATDEDTSQTLAFSLIDDDGGRFIVNGSRLEIAISPDYEMRKTHRVTVRVQDNGNPSLSISRNFTIDVVDVGEAPFRVNVTDDDGQLSFDDDEPRVEENSPRGTSIGKIVFYDYDENDVMTVRLDDDASGRFSTGLVKCQNSTNLPGVNTMCWARLTVAGDLDFEDDVEHDVIVRVTDSKGYVLLRRYTIEIVDVNDVPHDVSLNGSDVDENSNDAFIGCWTTDDEDPSHNHTYVLVDDAGGRFVVKGNCMFTSSRANLNFEVRNEYNVTVRSTDDGSPPLFRDESFLVTVHDVNEPPSHILVSNLTIRENNPVSAGVGVVTVIDPDNLGPRGVWQSHVCFAVGDAEGRFTVENNTLQVGVSDLDYERNSSWSIVLRCRDSGDPSLSSDQEFIVRVLNINERPEDIKLTGGTAKENEPPGQAVATFDTVDPDNEFKSVQYFNYSLEGVLPLDYPFIVIGNQLITNRPLDFEANPVWKAIVRSTDSGGLYMTKTFQIEVLNANDRPSGVRLSGLGSVPENSVDGTFVGQLFAEDEDAGENHTFRINVGQSGKAGAVFRVNSSTGVVSVMNGTALDYEAVRRYVLEVVATDSGGLSVVVDVTINVTDVNEAPTNIYLGNSQIPENRVKGSVIGPLSVEDPDNKNSNRQNHTCTLLTYSDTFEIVDGLKLAVGDGHLNYEEKRSYSVEIRCFDDGTPVLYRDETFYVLIIDVNESPTPARLLVDTVGENLSRGSLVGTVVSFDPDNEFYRRQSLSFILDNRESAPFVLNGSGLFTTAVLDFEKKSSYVLTVTVVDSGSPPISVSSNVTVYVIDANDQPTDVIFVSNGVKENSPGDTVVGFLKTIDEDVGQNYTYTFGRVTRRFYIDGNILKVASGANLNYEEESRIIINVKSNDSGRPSLSYSNDIIVVVLDVNEPPTGITSYRKDKIGEMSPAGTFVANLTVIDPDANQAHVCRLLNGSEYFTVVNDDGETSTLIVSDGAVIDYEKTPSIRVVVRCSDDGIPSLSLDHSFVVDVVDVNDPVTGIVLTGLTSLAENLAVGAVVGTLSPVDEDRGQTYYFNLTGYLANAFTIDNANRELIVARPIRFDFESLDHPVVSVTVNVFDDGDPPSTFSRTFFFNVTNVNEPPANVTIASGKTEIGEDVRPGEPIGVVTSQNPENDDNSKISYELISVNGVKGSKDFYLVVTNSSETVLYLNRSLDYTDVSTFALEILATDGDDPPASAFLTLSIDVKRTDPCATGRARCRANASCRRLSPTTSTCACDLGFSDRGNGGVCAPIDECAIEIDWNATSTSTRRHWESTAKVCNFGTCRDGINNFTCLCDAGYTGSDCSENIDECESNPCGNGGICVDGVDAFECQCSVGYEGPYCTNIDDCASSPCVRGTCVDGIADYVCTCPVNYIGDVCSFSATSCGDGTCPTQTTCVPTISASTDFLCVPNGQIVSVSFPSNASVDGTEFQRHWERWVKENLNISVSSVYIVGSYRISDSTTDIHFVVLVDNEPMPVTEVQLALCNIEPNRFTIPYEMSAEVCSALTPTWIPPSSYGLGGRVDPEDTWIIVIALIGVAIALLVIISGIVYVRSLQRKRRRYRAEALFPSDSDDFSSLSSPFSSLAASPLGGREEGVYNPLYESNDDVRDSGQFSCPNPLYSNPLYSDGVVTNPIYSDDNEMLANPVYDSSGDATNGDEPLYAEPRDVSQ